ncbi:hypothetical protein TRFO_22351 [Tritrichomonas foetus]|uniref:Uncharacterized protein n=1 Tax=Tritrichomonas foetus TaxID=1144522 RepID=A0A1J4KHX4_9EUKA|nr:hypothetical protein TRFO_22351 [Tritrichomonas foetus]|eukprot:OHT08933.1 hypothetical protein TRFO_22351 [Tritrichomonas foetus]
MRNSEKLTKAIDYYERNFQNRSDSRPTTGMVGQRCLGFIPDSQGNLIRVIPEIKGEESIGPGSYNPEKPRSKSRGVSISPNSKRTNFIHNDKLKIGPQSYVTAPKPTKYKHQIRIHDNSKDRHVFLSGNLEHQNWIQKSASPQPRCRFPATKFAYDQNQQAKPSSVFISKQKREIFVSEPDTTEIKYIPYQRPNLQDAADNVFKQNLRRTFDDPSTPVPAPCAYTLPDTMGKGKAFDLSHSWDYVTYPEEYDVNRPGKKINTPGPGAYEIDIKRKISKKNSPAFANKIPRYKDFEYDDDNPSPASYNIVNIKSFNENEDKIPLSLRGTSDRPQTSWNRTSLDDTPSPCDYNPGRSISTMGNKNKGVKIKGNSKKAYIPKQEDHEFAFSTQHSSMIKRTYNAKYYHVNKNLI